MTTYTITHHNLFESTSINMGWYNEDSGNLWVSFANGSDFYRYKNVPVEVWNGFISTNSAGHYYAKFIKTDYGPAVVESSDPSFDFSTSQVPVVIRDLDRNVQKVDEPFEYNAVATITLVSNISNNPRFFAEELLELVDSLNDTNWAYTIKSVENVETSTWR